MTKTISITTALTTIVALSLLLVTTVFASSHFDFIGTAGDTSVDADATSGGYYLRHVADPAPAGYSHLYQWANPLVVCDPNNTAVTFNGTVDVSNMAVGDVAMVGLVDRSLLENGFSGWASGAYVYVHKSNATTMRIGPTDGSLSGEIVQVFGTYPIPGDNEMDIILTIHDGSISVSVDGNTAHVDDYGTVKSQNNSVSSGFYNEDEFHSGAIVGWDVFPYAIDMPFDFDVTGCETPVERTAEITSPTAGSTISGLVSFEAFLTDDDADNVQWAVRQGTCAAGTNTVFGNVDGHSDVAAIDQSDLSNQTFLFEGDMSTMNSGLYCFIYNPTEDAGEAPIRETVEFNVQKATPTDKNECKNGGWESFTSPTFNNQGQCVSYVASEGKSRNNPGRGNR